MLASPKAAPSSSAVWHGILNACPAATPLAKAFEEAPSLIALFQRGGGDLVYLNGSGRRWLGPESAVEFSSLTLPDVIGVRSATLYENEILLQTKLFGKWTGACTLRDAWGSELAVDATLTEVPGETAGTKLLLLQAVKRTVGPDPNGDQAEVSDQELLHALLESIPDAVYFKDTHSRFIRASKSMSHKICGADPSAMIGHTDFDYFTADHAQPAYEAEQNIVQTGQPIIDIEEKETWPDGHVTWVSSTKMPLRDRSGRIVGTYGISHDISARMDAAKQKQDLEIQLQLAQRLESIGRLAAGIAHEINTPSQFVTDNTHFLVTSFKQLKDVLNAYEALATSATAHPACTAAIAKVQQAVQAADLGYLADEIPRTLEQTLDGLGRIARIVRSLKEFSHPNNAQRTAADLNRAIENAVTVTRHEWKYVAEVETVFDPALPPVPCVIDEFNQVMLNLLVNASHAIGSAQQAAGSSALGKITITTRHDGSWIYIDVADNGSGIPEEVRPRIFEPFFTTKGIGKGTGQGLTLVHTIVVTRHHGTVDFTSEVGRGTTFHLKLPRTQTKAPFPTP